jgi:predicted Zn-dependent peptidase
VVQLNKHANVASLIGVGAAKAATTRNESQSMTRKEVHNSRRTNAFARIVAILTLLVFSTVWVGQTASCQTPAQPARDSAFRLSNGLRVVIVEEPAFPLLSCQLWMHVGSMNDPNGASGTCHVVEHLLAETMKARGGALARQLVGSGGRFDAFTSDDFTVFLENLPASQLELGLALQTERLKERAFTPQELKEAAQQVIQEVEAGQTNPDRTLSREVRALRYTRHPYKNLPAGIEEEVKSVTPQMVSDFYRQYFTPSNATLVIAGDVNKARVLKLVEQTLGTIQRKKIETPVLVPFEPLQTGERRVYLKYGGKKNKLYIAYQAPSAGEQNAAAAAVLESLLGNSNAGLLKDFVVDTKVCDSVSAAFELRKRPGMLAISAEAPANVNSTKMLSTIEELCDKIKDGSFDDATLAEAKKRAVFSFLKSKVGPYKLAFQLGFFDCLDKLDQTELWQKQLEAVSKQDIIRLAAAYLVTPKRSVGFMLGQTSTPQSQKTASRNEVDGTSGDIKFVSQATTKNVYSTKETRINENRCKLGNLQIAAYDPYLDGSKTDSTDEPTDEAPETTGDTAPVDSTLRMNPWTSKPIPAPKPAVPPAGRARQTDLPPAQKREETPVLPKQTPPVEQPASSTRSEQQQKQPSSEFTIQTNPQPASTPKPGEQPSAQSPGRAPQTNDKPSTSTTQTNEQTPVDEVKQSAPKQVESRPRTPPSATQSRPAALTKTPVENTSTSSSDSLQRPPVAGLRSNMTEFILINGIRLLVFKCESSPIVRITGAVRAGHVYDPPAKPGLSDVTVSLMNSGSAKISKENSAKMQAQIGLDRSDLIRFFEGREQITFHTNCLAQDLATQLKLISHHLTDPQTDDTALSAARNLVVSTIKKRQNTTQDTANRLLLQNLLADKSQFNPPSPHELQASVLKITAEDINQFRANNVAPSTTTIVLAGNIDPAQAQRLVTNAFKDWQGRAKAPAISAQANKRQVSKVNLPNDEPVKVEIALGRLLSTPAARPEYAKLLLTDCAMIKHPLYARLTNPKRMIDLDDTVSIQSTIMPMAAQCAWIMNVRLTEPNIRGITSSIKQQFKELATTGITSQELAEMKRFIAGQVCVNRLADVFHSGDSIVDAVSTDREPDYWFNLPLAIESTSITDVNQFIKEEFQPERACVVVAGDKKAIRLVPSFRRGKD